MGVPRDASRVGATPRPKGLPGGRSPDDEDLRVAAVLQVLGGETVAAVAQQWSLDVALLHRWVRSFVEAGTSVVTNRPDEQAARQRDRFLAAFAHELRSPLTVAQGWVGLLNDGDLADDEIPATMTKLAGSLDRLAERTRDVELLAAASLGRIRIDPVQTTVRELMATLPTAQPTDSEIGEVIVEIDPKVFPRVLRDLWTAAALAPAPRSVHLEVALDDPWVEFRVVRDADPIPPPVLQALFDPFDINDDATGVTIGLYLARALAVVHGGTIGVEQDDQRAALWVRVQRHSRRTPLPTDAPPTTSTRSS